MRFAWLFAAVVLGALAGIALVRGFERLAFGGAAGPGAVPFLISAVLGWAAWTCFRRSGFGR